MSSPPPPSPPRPSPPPIKAPGRPFEGPRRAAPEPGDAPRLTRLSPRVRRELIIYGSALLFGLLVVPPLVWVAGNRVLGGYTHGQNLHAGPFALLGDFFVGLLHGSAVFWVVALGPAALVLLLRLFIALVRGMPGADREEPPPAPARRDR